MASPDVTPYVDLRLNDKDPQDVFDNAKMLLQTSLPDWIPRESATEVLLLEALALEVAESIFALNRLPSGIVEVLLRLFGITRDDGAPPTTTLRYHMVGTAGYTIPAGTQVRLNLQGGADPVVFTTNTQLDITAGDSFGIIAATGDRYTTEANGVVAGTVVENLDSLIYVDYVTLETDVVNGRDPETDNDYFERGVQRFSRLSDTLVVPRHFEIAALEQIYVERAKAIDNWNGVSVTPGSDAGHITVAVYGNNTTLTAPQKTELLTFLEASSLASLQVHLVDPSINVVPVTVQVRAYPGYTAAEVQANVEAAIQNYLDPMKWEWGTILRFTELVTEISNAVGVDYIVTMTTPTTNVNLTGNAPLVDAGTVTVTVQVP